MLKHALGSAVGKLRYQADQRQRQWKKDWQARIRRSHAQAAILMYHRVAPKDIDPWFLCVTPENFEAHLQVLKRYAQPMSLRELAIAQQTNSLPERAVAITFDDGYANNLYQAKPLLAKYDIPATVFVSTGYTESNKEFWWDALESVLLQPGKLPPALELSINGQSFKWDLGSAAQYSEIDYQADHSLAAWRASPNSRLGFYHQVWAVLQPLSESQRQAALDAIFAWAEQVPGCRESHRPLRSAELKQLERNGIVTVGAHTVNHPFLSKRSLEEQQQEIADGRDYLEKLLEHSVDTFAYPFGAYQPETVPMLATADFLCACTTVEETVWHGNVCYELPRFDVGNWSKSVFEQTLMRWFAKGYAE